MKYIVSDPKILSGTPIVSGTRVPVSRLLFLLKQGYSLKELHREYNHISLVTLENVVDELGFIVEKTTKKKQLVDEAQISQI